MIDLSRAYGLTDAVRAIPPPAFMVVDGARFEDVAARLKTMGLFGRALFLEQADANIELAGPWLVRIDDDGAASDAVVLATESGGGVFWYCPAGETALFHHLRTLNLVRIPFQSAGGGPAQSGDPDTMTALFRHWDPEVLGLVLPLLVPVQFARVLGDAVGIVFSGPGTVRGFRYAPRPEDLPPPQRGMLHFDAGQMAELRDVMTMRADRRIAGYLRDVAPEMTAGLSDDELRGLIARSEASAKELGLSSERGHARWAYLMLMSGGQAAHVPEARAFVSNGAEPPDRQVRKLIDHTAAALRRGDAGGRP